MRPADELEAEGFFIVNAPPRVPIRQVKAA
jgi:hypothetical protein